MANAWKKLLTEVDIGVSVASKAALSGHIENVGLGGHLPSISQEEGTFLNNSGGWSTPAGTTYTSGTGLTLTGTVFSHSTHTGEVTGAAELTIKDNAVTLAKMATLTEKTIIGNDTAGALTPKALTVAEVRALLSITSVENTSDANKPVSTATANALALKAPLASPDLTGTPTAPTPATSTNSTQIATTAFVKDQGYLRGNESISISGDVTGSGTTSISAELASVGIAGTYRRVTTDAKGRVTSGDNPTTISGYGLTDALRYFRVATLPDERTSLGSICLLSGIGVPDVPYICISN